MVTYQCACGKQIELDEDNAGYSIKCPACQQLGTVPATAHPHKNLTFAQDAVTPFSGEVDGWERRVVNDGKLLSFILFVATVVTLPTILFFGVLEDLEHASFLVGLNLFLWSGIGIAWFRENYNACQLKVEKDKVRLRFSRDERIYRVTEIQKIIVFTRHSAVCFVPWRTQGKGSGAPRLGFAPKNHALASLVELLRTVYPKVPVLEAFRDEDEILRDKVLLPLVLFAIIVAGYWGFRLTLVNQFGFKDPLCVVFPLHWQLGSEDPVCRERALLSLEGLDSTAKTKITPRLIGKLKDPKMKSSMSLALSRAGSPAVTLLLSELRRSVDKPGILNILVGMGAQAEEATFTLGEVLKERDPFLTDLAMQSLIQIGEPAVPVLEEALEDPAIRKKALISLAAIGTVARPAFTKISRYLNTSDGLYAALAAIKISPEEAQKLGAQEQLQRGIESLSEKLLIHNPRFRRSASEELRDIAIGAQPSLPALMEALKLPEDESTVFVLETVGKLGPAGKIALPFLVQSMNERGPNSSRAAQKALVELGSEVPEVVEAMAQQLKSKKSAERILAAEVLGRIGPEAKAAVTALLEARNQSKGKERKSILVALIRIEGK